MSAPNQGQRPLFEDKQENRPHIKLEAGRLIALAIAN